MINGEYVTDATRTHMIQVHIFRDGQAETDAVTDYVKTHLQQVHDVTCCGQPVYQIDTACDSSDDLADTLYLDWVHAVGSIAGGYVYNSDCMPCACTQDEMDGYAYMLACADEAQAALIDQLREADYYDYY